MRSALFFCLALLLLIPSTAIGSGKEDTVRQSINYYRKHNGKAVLKPHWKIDVVAQMRSNSMIRRGYFGHVSPSGIDAGDLLRKVKYKCRYWGEIIAWEHGHFGVRSIMSWWKNSWPHRYIMLKDKWRSIGVGIAYKGQRTYYTVVFTSCR